MNFFDRFKVNYLAKLNLTLFNKFTAIFLPNSKLYFQSDFLLNLKRLKLIFPVKLNKFKLIFLPYFKINFRAYFKLIYLVKSKMYFLTKYDIISFPKLEIIYFSLFISPSKFYIISPPSKFNVIFAFQKHSEHRYKNVDLLTLPTGQSSSVWWSRRKTLKLQIDKNSNSIVRANVYRFGNGPIQVCDCLL